MAIRTERYPYFIFPTHKKFWFFSSLHLNNYIIWRHHFGTPIYLNFELPLVHQPTIFLSQVLGSHLQEAAVSACIHLLVRTISSTAFLNPFSWLLQFFCATTSLTRHLIHNDHHSFCNKRNQPEEGSHQLRQIPAYRCANGSHCCPREPGVDRY